MYRRAILAVCTLLSLAACATNPVSGHKELALMSQRQELALGREADPQVRREFGVYADTALQRYVDRVGQQLAAHSHRADIPYHFAVLDSADVNAFALPGGYVYITRGILPYLQSEAELAAVLGHEIGHVTARHGVRQYTAQALAGIGYTVTSIFVPALQAPAGQDLFNTLGNVWLRGYGREHELEADHLGAEYLARDGYDPNAMLGVLHVLKNQERYEEARARAEGRRARVYHGVFSTHPSTDTRLQDLVREAARFKASTAPVEGRRRYLARIDGLAFGDSEQQGIRRGHCFYHKPLGVAVCFPKGWALKNGADALDATDPAHRAAMQLRVFARAGYATPRDLIERGLKLTRYDEGRALDVRGNPGFTAVATLNTPFGPGPARVTVVFLKDKAFVFFGAARKDERVRYDGAFLDTARELHALRDGERKLAEPLRIHIITARAGDTFASLAAASPLPANAEALLRLINDRYPAGEPVAGQPLKIVR